MKIIFCSLVFYISLFEILTAQNIVTFRVDMKAPLKSGLFRPDRGDKLLLRGNFNNWLGESIVLYDEDKDSIYIVSYEIMDSSIDEIEYKFVLLENEGKVIWEWKPNPGNQPYGNRSLSLTGIPQVTDNTTFSLNNYYQHYFDGKIFFSVKELKDDFNALRKALEEIHCNLYEYTDKAKFDSLFEHQYNLITRPMQPHEFFNIVSPLFAKAGCMHTSIWMSNEYWDYEPDNLFPLQIKLIEDYAVVSGSYGVSNQIPVGSIIRKINSLPINEIIVELKKSYSSDGGNEQFKYAQVEKRFPMALARVYGFPEKYIVTFTRPGSTSMETISLIPANIQSVKEIVFRNFHYPPLTLGILDEKSTAILTIPSFIFYDRVVYFKSFIDSTFTVIKNKEIQNLILDLRGNDGGDPFCAVPLFSYLEKEPVKYFAEEYGRYSEFAHPIPLAKNNFTGNLYTLIDKHCGSTNGHFCSLLKYNKIGKFIGTEGGATYKCNAKTKEVILENTRLIMNIAQQTYSAAVEGMDKTKGVEPDYYIDQTYMDFLIGEDTQINFAMDLIQ